MHPKPILPLAAMSLRIAALTAGIMLLGAGWANGQSIEWAQVTNLPKGMNMPPGTKADILGIEAGASYAEVKPILDALLKEGRPQPKPNREMTTGAILNQFLSETTGASSSPPIEETKRTIYLDVPGGSRIQGTYVARFLLDRKMPGSTNQDISDSLIIDLSAPSSGHQVLNIERTIIYPTHADQPKISDVVAALKEKFKTTPLSDPALKKYTFVFNNGAPAATPAQRSCSAGADNSTFSSEADISNINPKRACDVVISLSYRQGISSDHASAIWFYLSDYERSKANKTTDYGFFASYVEKLRGQTRGKPPKL